MHFGHVYVSNLPCMVERNGQTGRRAAALLGGRHDGLASHKFGSIKIAPHRLDVSLGFI